MAEYVEFRMQEMLPVLEKIDQTGLMRSNHVKELSSIIRERELKIQRPSRTLEDFITYFVCLKNLVDILKQRRKKTGYSHNYNEIEERLHGIIKSRFGMASHNFKHDLKFWAFQINFLKGMNWMERVSDVFTEVTKLHGPKYPYLWIEASDFEWSRKPGKGIDTARQFVQLGLRHHKNSLALYVQGFRLELKFVEHIKSSPRQQKEILEGENGKAIVEEQVLARTYYNLAKKECRSDGPNVCLEFYKVAQMFPFTSELREEIESNLIEEHTDSELAYDLSAKIKLAAGGKLSESALLRAIEVYEHGLKIRPTVKMYDYYFATLKLLEAKVIDQIAKLKLVKLQNELFQRAHGNMKLSEKNYVNWYCQLQKFEEDEGETCSFLKQPKYSNGTHSPQYTKKKVLKLGLQKFPSSAQLNTENIKNKLRKFDAKHMSHPKTSDLEKLLKTALVGLSKIQVVEPSGENDLSIWTDIILYFMSHSNSTPKLLRKIIESAPMVVQANLKCLYIQHMSWTDIKKARSFYKKECFSPNISLEFHLIMGKIELQRDSIEDREKFEGSRLCYENAIRRFGNENIDLWLKYIDFERNVSQNPKAASTLYRKALENLNPTLKENFILAEAKVKANTA